MTRDHREEQRTGHNHRLLEHLHLTSHTEGPQVELTQTLRVSIPAVSLPAQPAANPEILWCVHTQLCKPKMFYNVLFRV